MKTIFRTVKFFFTGYELAILKYSRNGRVIKKMMINKVPHVRVQVRKRNSDGIITKELPYSDVLKIIKYPSRFAHIVFKSTPKAYRIELKRTAD